MCDIRFRQMTYNPEYTKNSFKSVRGKEPFKNGKKIQTFSQKTKIGNYRHEKMLYILSHQGYANYCYNEIDTTHSLERLKFQTLTILCVCREIKQQKRSHAIGSYVTR